MRRKLLMEFIGIKIKKVNYIVNLTAFFLSAAVDCILKYAKSTCHSSSFLKYPNLS